MFTKATRPLKALQLCKQVALWIALGLSPESFDAEIVRSILGSFFKQYKKEGRDAESCLTDKQYNGLYNIYDKFRIHGVFQMDALKFICVDLSKFDKMEVLSESNQVCQDFYFEVLLDKRIVKYTVCEFIDLYRDLILHPKYMTRLPPTPMEDFD